MTKNPAGKRQQGSKARTERRRHALLVLFTAEERTAIASAASKVGLSSGAFVRMAGLLQATPGGIPSPVSRR